MGLIQKQYDQLRKKIKKSEIENQRRAFDETRNRQKQNLALMGDLEKIKEQVKRIRSEAVGNWDLLEKAIGRLEKNQFTVIRAADAQEACEIVLREIGEERLVVKSKSNISKEIGLTPFLRQRDIEIIETDIGDRIAQMAGHRASHYTGPIVHLSRNEIAEILSKHLGKEVRPIPEEEMEAVREDLEPYLRSAKIGITGANAIAADEGAALILHNEGNVTRVRTRSKHILLTSIDKIYPRLEDAILMLRLETYLATGAIFPSFIDIIGGRSKSADIEKTPFYGMHDPSSLVLILLDNGRRRLLEEKKDSADLLYCIGCGNCLLDCPTYTAVGPSFGTDGMLGGRGVALSCLQRGLEVGIEDGLFLCTTCGLCGEVCPVGIDGGKRLKDLRRSSLELPPLRSQLQEVTQVGETIDTHGTPTEPWRKESSSLLKRKRPWCSTSDVWDGRRRRRPPPMRLSSSKQLGVDFTLVDEVCCEAVKEEIGLPADPERMRQNIERMKTAGGREILFLCPTCLKTFQDDDRSHPTGLTFTPLSSYLREHFRFTPSEKDPEIVTYHDPCHLGRGLGKVRHNERASQRTGKRVCRNGASPPGIPLLRVRGRNPGVLPQIFERHRSQKGQRSRGGEGRSSSDRLPLVQT